MGLKMLFLTFLISLSALSFPGDKSPFLSQFKLTGFSCETKVKNGCHFQECSGKIPTYTQSILILIPQQVSGLRLHFHGHKLNKFPEYDRNLSSMIDAFDLRAAICESKEMVVFPESTGNCKDYDEQLKTKSDFETFLKDLNVAMNGLATGLPIHISAHSGGGRTIGRYLSQGMIANEVTIFDGIYSNDLKNQISSWYQKSSGQLKLNSIKGLSPHSYVSSMMNDLNLEFKKEEMIIKNKKFRKFSGDRIQILNRDYTGDALKAHYDIVSETWK